MGGKFYVAISLLLAVILLQMNCAPSVVPIQTSIASLGYVTSVHKDLTSLPPPKEKIYVAVYKFRDQTGQYKTSASGITWSTAVTQGATSMLLKALEDSGWFIVLEREGLSNLLNERKIIRSTRENYRATGQKQLPPLPPLLYAGITLEGGIVSYESNIVTGGLGAKYFGIGASTQYRKDEVTIYLRAVSTQNGRVLKTVYTTKSILSMAVDANVYRFVRFKRLLEVETGYSFNEPTQMCVQEAIEKAVLSLIIEGILDKLWLLENPQDITSPVINQYLKEKENVENMPRYYTQLPYNRKRLGAIVTVGGQYYYGDLAQPEVGSGMDFSLRYNLSSIFGLQGTLGLGNVVNRYDFESFINLFELRTVFNFFPTRTISPNIFLGTGLLSYQIHDRYGNPIPVTKRRKYISTLMAGLGFEYSLNPNFSLTTTFDYHYVFTDQLDGLIEGRYKDAFWSGKVGLVYYIGF